MAVRPRVVMRGPRRQTEWLGSVASVAESIRQIGGSTVVLDQNFTQAQIQVIGPFTIVRTIGELVVAPDQFAADEQVVGAMGFMVVREQARLIGITAVLTPFTENFDDGFFGHLYWNTSVRFATAAGFDTVGWTHYPFDFKSQRKVTPDDAIVITMENGATAAFGAEYRLDFRMLIKLH